MTSESKQKIATDLDRCVSKKQKQIPIKIYEVQYYVIKLHTLVFYTNR